MPLRRLLTSAAVVGLLAAVPADAAPERYRLDGGKARARQYTGTLTSPHVSNVVDPADPMKPYANGCNEYSCDLRELSLVLPAHTTYGKFRASVLLPTELNAALVLYDANLQPIVMDEVWRERDRKQAAGLEDASQYRLYIQKGFLSAGRYTLGVIDRAGIGEFTANVEWVAHPPDRPSARR